MSFIALLFALLLEQVRPLASGHGLERVFTQWADWLKNNLDTGDIRHGWTTWGLAVGLPCLVVVAVHWLLVWYLGWIFAMVWSLAVVYVTLGFRRFSHHFTGIRDALAAGDDILARALLRDWQGEADVTLTRSEIVRHVIEFSALAAHRHVFGVMAWFSLLAALGLGPVGALLFRLSSLLFKAWGKPPTPVEGDISHTSDALQHVVDRAWYLVDWLPSRMTALSFAVVGNFEDAVDAWRQEAGNFPGANDAASRRRRRRRQHGSADGRTRTAVHAFAQHGRPGLACGGDVDGAAGADDIGAFVGLTHCHSIGFRR